MAMLLFFPVTITCIFKYVHEDKNFDSGQSACNFLESRDQLLDNFLQSTGCSNLNKNLAEETQILNSQTSNLHGVAYGSPFLKMCDWPSSKASKFGCYL